MKLILRLVAVLQAVAAYLNATLPSLLTLLKKVPAIMRGDESAKADEQRQAEE